jgi:iron complex transport system substrate-binding protein
MKGNTVCASLGADAVAAPATVSGELTANSDHWETGKVGQPAQTREPEDLPSTVPGLMGERGCSRIVGMFHRASPKALTRFVWSLGFGGKNVPYTGYAGCRARSEAARETMKRFPPERIVCLTEETVETLYLLGEQHRIVGVSGYAVRPRRVRQEKPRVSAFTSADIPKILSLAPDLVLTFSDLQAEIAAELIKTGVTVIAYNQRDVAGIFAMIRHLGATVGQGPRAEQLAGAYEQRLERIAAHAERGSRPLVYFEEWDDPMISGIAWVSELIGIAGGRDAFPELAAEAAARDRVVTSEQVITAAPDVILASWCGRKVRPEKIAARPGWGAMPAVRDDRIFEIKSPLILQPGPAALTDGLDAIVAALGDNPNEVTQ